MFDFIESNVDFSTLDDEQSDIFDAILSHMENIKDDDADEDGINETTRIRKKISPADRRKRKIEYRKNRASLKRKAKKLRKTSKFKKYKNKAKRMAKRGKTATGKRQSKFF